MRPIGNRESSAALRRSIFPSIATLGVCASLVLAGPPATTGPATTAAPAGGSLHVQSQRQGAIVIDGTLEAALDYPRVEVKLTEGDRVLTGTGSESVLGFGSIRDINDIGKLLDNQPNQAPARVDHYSAFLDTGASASVLAKATAQNFGVQAEPGAVYHEAGLHGQTPMSVSKSYGLSIRGVGNPADAPGEYFLVQKQMIFQISTIDSNPLVEMVMGQINIIGMPAIQKFVVEIKTGGTGGAGLSPEELANLDLSDLDKPEMMAKLESVDAGPAVKLHPGNFKPGLVDLIVPLEYVTYSRRNNPDDKGTLPSLADNPTVQGVKTTHEGKTFSGRWLLDTGAPASIISTKQAQALGLFDEAGKATREPDFTLPLGGIGGKVEPVPGFRIDQLIIPAAGNSALDYRHVYVLVNDVSTTLDDGKTVTLDGILGTNLWFPTVAGISSGFPTNAAPSAYETVWIDGPGKKMLFKLAPVAQAADKPQKTGK